MAKSKKSGKSKSSVQVKDLRSKKNPKGGALNAYVKLSSPTIKIESPTTDTTALNTSLTGIVIK